MNSQVQSDPCGWSTVATLPTIVSVHTPALPLASCRVRPASRRSCLSTCIRQTPASTSCGPLGSTVNVCVAGAVAGVASDGEGLLVTSPLAAPQAAPAGPERPSPSAAIFVVTAVTEGSADCLSTTGCTAVCHCCNWASVATTLDAQGCAHQRSNSSASVPLSATVVSPAWTAADRSSSC